MCEECTVRCRTCGSIVCDNDARETADGEWECIECGLEHKGDGKGSGKVMMSFMIPADLRQELKERAERLGTSSARLIVDGVRLKLKQYD